MDKELKAGVLSQTVYWHLLSDKWPKDYGDYYVCGYKKTRSWLAYWNPTFRRFFYKCDLASPIPYDVYPKYWMDTPLSVVDIRGSIDEV